MLGGISMPLFITRIIGFVIVYCVFSSVLHVSFLFSHRLNYTNTDIFRISWFIGMIILLIPVLYRIYKLKKNLKEGARPQWHIKENVCILNGLAASLITICIVVLVFPLDKFGTQPNFRRYSKEYNRTITKKIAWESILIDKHDTEDPVMVGEKTTYIIKIHNDGPGDAYIYSIENKIPKSTSLVKAQLELPNGKKLAGKLSGRILEFDDTTLKSGETFHLSITVLVKGAGFLINGTTVHSFGKPIYVEESTTAYK